MKRVIIDNLDDTNSEFFCAAQIDPKYQGNQYIDRIDIMQRDEGPIPHMHVKMKTGKIAYVRLDVPKYSNHHKNGYILNTKEKKELDAFLRKLSNRHFVQSYTSEDVKKATNFEYAADVWIETWGGEDKFQFDSEGYPIQPDYTQL